MLAMRRTATTLLVALALACAALFSMSGTLSDPVRWTPDGLFYQARSLELQGTARADALRETFQGPLAAELRQIDPARTGDPAWVSYNAQFYERRVAVPAAAAALEPLAGERAILDLSVAGYVAAVLAIFGFLLLRFRLPIAAAVAFATVLLPALTKHSSFPLTDSWGLALETAALAAGTLALERGRRWVIAWAAAVLLLAFTRDSALVLVAAAAWVALTQRSKVSAWMLGTGVAASLAVLALFPMPTRELLAMMLNGAQPDPDASWGAVLSQYPGAIVDMLQADGGAVRGGAWFTAAYLLLGVGLLFVLGRGARGSAVTTLLKAGAVAGAAYVVAIPVFSAFRLELVLVPMAAFGLALGIEWLAARASVPKRAGAPIPAPGRAGI
jgi:hypothetical protein